MTEQINPTDEVDIQTGSDGAAPADLDAAGDDHPLGTEASKLGGNLDVIIRDYADGQYSSPKETVREYIANAETACIRTEQRLENDESVIADDDYDPVIDITYDREEQKFIIADNGIGMSSHEFENGFSHVGASASRDEGERLGQFGVGALSFVQLVGIDNHILIKTHSRITDENYSAYFSLGGPTPLVGQLPDEQYGTVFEMAPNGDWDDFRNAVDEYAEFVSVPVRYTEYDESGEEVYNEEYGDKSLMDDISNTAVATKLEKEGYFRAVASPECTGRTLLVSMPVDRNSGNSSSESHNSPFTFDVRLLDETGRVMTGPNEGKIPCSRIEYEQMLEEARQPYITADMLDEHDAVEIDGEPTPISECDREDVLGSEIVSGLNEGSTVVSDEEWNSMAEGRAEQYIPQDELTEQDICMPKPTTDRARLEENAEFWTYLSTKIEEKFRTSIEQIVDEIEQRYGTENAPEAIREMDKGKLDSFRED